MLTLECGPSSRWQVLCRHDPHGSGKTVKTVLATGTHEELEAWLVRYEVLSRSLRLEARLTTLLNRIKERMVDNAAR